MSKNLRGLSERRGLKNSIFGEIVKSSKNSPENNGQSIRELADELLIGQSSISGPRSFYDFLRSGHKGKKLFVCNGTACLTSGKQEKLRRELSARFKDDEIGTVTCLGHCHTNNAFMYKGETFSLSDLSMLDDKLASSVPASSPFHTFTNVENPPLLSEIKDLQEYYGLLSEVCVNIPGALKEIELSALRGRGGAGFPFYIKIKSAADAVSDKKYVVCNADEGDPGAFSDKWILEERTHALLFGMLITGLVTGADTGVVYIRGEYPESVAAVKSAAEQIDKEGYTLFKMAGNETRFRFHVVEGAGAYICGEETSLLNSLEGLRPEVRTRPPFPAQYGLFGKPTVLSNVETFANIRYILKEGGAAYSDLGTKKSAGTKLVSLDGGFVKPGIYEVRMGTPLEVVFNNMGGGTRYPVKAFQIGGPLGGIVPMSRVGDLRLDFESFSEEGFLLGHAGVVSIPEEFPMIEYLLHLFEFMSAESCGKCFPCRIGTEMGSDLLRRAVDRKEKINSELFSDLLETLQYGSLCALGGGLPLPVVNAMNYFNDELEEFFTVKNITHE
jgi:NADH-quinone oxidoreductase subunit F